MRFSYTTGSGGFDHNAGNESKCWEMFHPEVRSGPVCSKDVGHEEPHEGSGIRWREEPQVDTETALRFLKAYRSIPNSYHEIELGHDGMITVTLRGLEAATRFISVRSSD